MTDDPDRLRTDEILKINQELARRGVPYTGAEEYHVRTDKVERLVKNAPSRGPIDVAAYYLKNLALLQPFPNGNHRTALIAAEIFLKRKGYRFDYTADEADQLRDQMLKLQFKLYGTYEELPETVTTEPGNELFRLCRDFVEEHTMHSTSEKKLPARRRSSGRNSRENAAEKVERVGSEFLIRLRAGKYAYIKYHIGRAALHIDSTFVPEEHRGRGLAETLTKAVIKYAGENNLKIVPDCSYAKRYFERHPEYKNLITPAQSSQG